MLTYKKLLMEMAKNIGSPFSIFERYPNSRKERYGSYSSLYGSDETGVKTYVQRNGHDIHLATVDHDSKELLHNSIIKHNDKTDKFPYEHIVQNGVDRVKSTDKIPKGFATDAIYNFWKTQHLPLRSSDTQYDTGHKMWHRLVDKALDDNKHVSFWDGTSMHSVSHKNKKDYLKKSFGDYEDSSTQNNHIVISHEKIGTP